MVRIAMGLAFFVAVLETAGFIVAGTGLFACTASAFGSRRLVRDGLGGLALCTAVYVAFTRGLGIPLP